MIIMVKYFSILWQFRNGETAMQYVRQAGAYLYNVMQTFHIQR